MTDFEEMGQAIARASETTVNWRKMYEDAEKRLLELQKEHWAIREELMTIKYNISLLAKGKYNSQ